MTFLGAQLPLTGLTWLALGVADARARIALVGSGVIAIAWGAAIQAEGDRLALALLFVWPATLVLLTGVRHLGASLRQRFVADDARSALRWVLAVVLLAGTFATVRYEHVAVKYLLLPLPAAVLLALDGHGQLRGRLRLLGAVWLLISLVVGAATGLAVALSDYRWANGYRDFVVREFPQPPRQPVYYNAQWGLRFYAERAGLLPYRGGPFEPGARLVVSEKVPPNWEITQLPRGIVGRHELAYPGPFALLDFDRNAGFYSNFWGDWPFAPAARVTDRILVLADPDRREPQPGRGPAATPP